MELQNPDYKCVRNGKFIIAGRNNSVSHVLKLADDDVEQESKKLVADVAVPNRCPNMPSCKVAVAAWKTPEERADMFENLVHQFGVRILAGEFHEDVNSMLDHMRKVCKINLAAWKPWKTSNTHFAISTSLIFVLGPIGGNKPWVEPMEMCAQLGTVVPVADYAVKDFSSMYTSLNKSHRKTVKAKDNTFGWPWIQKVRQTQSGFPWIRTHADTALPSDSEQLAIWAGGNARAPMAIR